MGLELFISMVKEEWRLHSTMFGSISFALFPVLILAISFMAAFLLPLFRSVLPGGEIALVVTGSFLLLGVMVGGFGLLGNEVMNRRFGQMSLLAYSARSLPLSERYIFTNFVVKDIVYYLILWVFPFVLGYALAAPLIGTVPLDPWILLFSVTLTFLAGLSLVFLLSTIYARSKLALLLLFSVAIAAGGILYMESGIRAADFFPPLQLLRSFSPEALVLSCLIVIIPFAISILLFSPEFSGTTRRFTNQFDHLVTKLSFFPTPPLAAKDLIDLWRSGGGIGQFLFSFFLPLGIIWFFLSILNPMVPGGSVILVYALVSGIISATMYTWITSFDTFGSYSSLPVSVSTLITSKICTFSVLQVVPAVFIAGMTIVTREAAYLPVSILLWGSVSFYCLAVSVFLTGLSPNVLVYDPKVLLMFMILVGIPVLFLIALVFVNPFLGLLAPVLAIPAYGLIKKAYRRWEEKEVSSF